MIIWIIRIFRVIYGMDRDRQILSWRARAGLSFREPLLIIAKQRVWLLAVVK